MRYMLSRWIYPKPLLVDDGDWCSKKLEDIVQFLRLILLSTFEREQNDIVEIFVIHKVNK